jgi:hypothetical protein
MIIIPEIEKVLILVPRVASTALKIAVLEKYKESILIYRHMEADGVPKGYDRWEKIGVVRDPIDRLWSLYSFLKNFDGPYEKEHIAQQRSCIAGKSFSDWILTNKTVFTNPYDAGGSLKFYPRYTVGHSLPENRKSQFLYLRPDLGTKIFKYSRLDDLLKELNIDSITPINGSGKGVMPKLTKAAEIHIDNFFKWDLATDL